MGSRSGVAMLVVTVGRRFRAGRERLGEELLVGFGFFVVGVGRRVGRGVWRF